MGGISRLGMEFSQHVFQVTQELLCGTPTSLSDMERQVRAALLRLGQFLLGAWIMLQEGPYPPSRIACPCGGEAAYLSKREATLLTLLGRVTYQRAYYVCPRCHKGVCPLDQQLGLRPGELSAELESLAGMTGTVMAFNKGGDLFERLTLVSISPQSMDRATQSLGAEMVQLEQEWMQASAEGLALRAQERAPKEGRLYGALDATKVHTHETEGPEDQGWRDLKVGAWFVTDAPPPQRPQEDWDIHAEQISYYCDFAEAKAFGKLLWATGFQRRALQAQELIFLGDGAEWIWNLVHEHYPQATQIVDWFHAAEHLAAVAKAAFGEEEARQRWHEDVREQLWEGKVAEVIAACEALAKGGRGQEEASQAATYFRNNASRMDYGTYRSKGYQIGSGTIESGCKQLGIQRMKVPGATWNLEGARLTAKARAAFLSNQWDLLTARREYLPRVA
jgi:hypothetical protein